MAPTRLAAMAVIAISLAASGCSTGDDSVESTDESTALTEAVDTIEATVTADELELSAGQATQEVEQEIDDGSADFIDLPYWEVFLLEGLTLTVQPAEECDVPEPDVSVCEYVMTGSLVGTQIGQATEVQTGTRTTYSSETCGGPGGSTEVRVVQDGGGTITSEWGDTLDFRVRQGCGLIHWTPTGGTGRFEDATGLMSGIIVPPLPGVVAVNTGTLTVRADLWQDLFPVAAD